MAGATTSRPLALGLVGCGKVARERHVPALRDVSEVRVVALADPDAEARAAVARSFPGVGAYAGHAELLKDGSVEAVGVLVPPSLHADVVLAALDAGKHVFVEKPLCLALDEAHSIRRRVEETGLTLMVGFNLRHHPLVRKAGATVASGKLGDVVALQSSFTTALDGPARALTELAAHHLDLWRFLLQDDVDVLGVVGDEVTASLVAKSRSGVAISFVVTQRSAQSNECVVYGTRGSLRLSPYRFDGLELQSATELAGDPRLRLRRLAGALPMLPRARGGFVRSYREQWLAFAGAVRSGHAEPGVEDGVRNVELLLAVKEAVSSA